MSGRLADRAGTWLIAASAGLCVAVLLALLGWLACAGLAPFWPLPVEQLQLRDGRVLLGEVVAADTDAIAVRTSEVDRPGQAYQRVRRADIVARSRPADAVTRTFADGRRQFARGGEAEAPPSSHASAVSPPFETIRANALGPIARGRVFVGNVGRFVGDAPVGSSISGGVFPALVGTVTLVVLMSVVVMPLGVATAVFLHRRRGPLVRGVRATIDTLAGVPSIVYGVLGLGLFVNGIGAGIDRWLYADRLPLPTFGSGGLLWAALTLALLTLPVVVVSIEEGLARIPPGLREGSLALGATRDETLWRLLLPVARPALLSGFVLAIARAAGAAAPLMLVGVVKLAPVLPFDGTFPYLHPSRQFMHLGFTIYGAALASPDTIRGVPRAYACALLLVGVVVMLNLSAILLRNRLRDRYRALQT